MSRHPVDTVEQSSREQKIAEYVRFKDQTSTLVALTSAKMKEATLKDGTLQEVMLPSRGSGTKHLH